MNEPYKPCAVIPVYRHGKPLRAVVEGLLARGLPVFVVDDGNEAETRADIQAVKDAIPEVELVTLPENRGKGGAVLAGFRAAFALGYTHAFQIDADGQHDLGPVESFLAASRARPGDAICGYPVYDESVPSARKNGRKVTNFWVAIETLSLGVKDAMCGFRLYPLRETLAIANRKRLSERMTFDIEILVRLAWAGVALQFVPIKVIYPEGGVSNFRLLQDNIAISAQHARLFFGMLPRLPVLIARKVSSRAR